MSGVQPVAVRGIRGRGPAGIGTHVVTTDNNGQFNFSHILNFTTKSEVASGAYNAQGANPSATASDVAVNGTATTFLRSDGAPAVQKTSSSVFGIAKVDGTSIVATGGVISASGSGGPVGANPTATASDVAVNGTAVTFLRSDGAPAVQKCSSSAFGLCKVDNTTITASGGIISSVASEPSITRFTTVPAHPGFDPQMIRGVTIVLSNNNKTATPASGGPYNHAYGTPSRYTGKWYWEMVPGSISFEICGFSGAGGHSNDYGYSGNFGQVLDFPGQIGWGNSGAVFAGNSGFATINTWVATNVLCFALDIDNLLAWFRVGSGNWNNDGTANPATGVGGLSVPMCLNNASNGLIWPGCNMGNTTATKMFLLSADFAQTAPTGFSPWGGS